MEFPVDLLADVSQVELEQSAHNYINNLLYSNPDLPEHLILSDSTQVTINISSVGFTPLYGLSDKHKILALFSPSDPMTAVALYLLDQWWTVDDILKTADPDRDGAMEVETLGERVVLYILNRIIYRAKEMTSEELPFLCHGEKDCAKILWNKGEAVGFYSVKPSGSIYNSSSTRSYLLPVMDSIFVRKCHRGKGFGFQMLEDFVLSSHEDCLGLRYPLTKSMYKVCQKYLCQYPEHTDLLWEVESIGGPSQRTNIARKIQAMDLSVSKSLVFTEESVVITEMTETDVVMEAIPTQIKETESVECTVDIVEEVTVRRATKVSEAELPVAARGRSGGSKRRNVEERITEEKSEKIIRIEDIEAETPRDEQLGAQQKTELNDGSELVQTEGMFSIGEDVVDTAPKEAATATISDTPATVLPSQDLEEDDVTATPTTVKPQVEDDLNTSHDSQITVENVASEIEEAEEEHKEEDSAVLVAQHVVSLSTHATSEGGEAGKTGRAVVKAIKIVQSETPRRRSQRHRKLEEEITAQDRGRVLRARTVMSTATPKRNSTRHSHKVNEESEKEVDVAEENNVSSTEVLEELTVTGGKELEEIASIKEDVTTVEELKEEVKQQVEDEELTSAEETEKQEEPGVKDTVVKGSSTELPDTAKNALTEVNVDEKVTDESEKEQKGEEVEKSVVEDKQQVSDDEIEEPPVVQKRASRGRRKVTPKSTQQSEGHKKQEEERTDEADLGAGSAASEEKADEKAMDKQMEEETVDKTEENKSTEELTVVEEGTKAEEPAEDVTPSTEVKVEECMEVQEDKETEGGTETVSVMEADKDKEEDDMIQDPNTVATASETVTPDEVDETAISVAEEPQEKDIEIPKLQKATVILVDLKTCSHLSVKEAEETPADGECSAPEKELISAEEKDISSYVAEEQAPEPKMLVLEEEDGGKQENNTEESLDATAEAETVEKQELEEDSSDKEKKESANVDGEMSEAEEAPFVEARVLRSGRKLVKETYQQYNIGDVVTEKEVDEAEPGNGEVEGEKEVTGKDAVAVTVPVEEKPSAESLSKICADTEPDIPVVDDTEDNLPPAEGDDAISLEEDETPGGTKTPRCKTTRKQADEQEAESSEEEETAVTTRTLSRGRESASATPKGKSRRSRKQEEEQKGAEESKKIEETGGDEGKAPEEDQMEVEEEEPLPVEVKEASIEERGEKNEREIEAVSKKEESVEQTIDVEEGKAVAEEGQYVEEEQLEAIVASAEKTLQEEEDGPKESAKEAEVEEEKEEKKKKKKKGCGQPKSL
ncbi:soluble lamin-associated protein of 75 kDa isoform X2 [Dicentrarchus labrax]|uniref:soluble lamin-associated protein of 75 kDa isoform X2 n=1 Tax=Dicentrarchus labrax TaxID=13489 RepID=UPI0021F5CFDF|nr:soluble lamin-associated protein of 75 kDa isoform X2 [Dicentrarchus labrax]